jgi:hypothetical protein
MRRDFRHCARRGKRDHAPGRAGMEAASQMTGRSLPTRGNNAAHGDIANFALSL